MASGNKLRLPHLHNRKVLTSFGTQVATSVTAAADQFTRLSLIEQILILLAVSPEFFHCEVPRCFSDLEGFSLLNPKPSTHLHMCILHFMASCFKQGRDEEGSDSAINLVRVCTFPDGGADSLRLGRSCGGSCLSRCTFPMCELRDEHFPTGVVVNRRWTSKLGHCIPFLCGLMKKLRIPRRNSTPPLLSEAHSLAATRQVIESLRHGWGSFFGDYNRFLTLGKKLNSGTEGDILQATWRCDDGCHYDVVVKVFNRVEQMRVLSTRMLERMAESGFDSFAFCNSALIFKATLLRDGRFGLVLRRYSCNLDELIERRMKRRGHDQEPPFLDREGKHLMCEVAKGMHVLHRSNILHRDLKPANVLILECPPVRCYVADFECDRAIGTGFYRSPEVLRMLTGREDANSEIINSFESHSDVYSFGMTCYAICTGLAPFANVGRSAYSIVLNGERPVLPEFVDVRVRALIGRCWHPEPSERPSFGEIVEELGLMMASSSDVNLH